MQTWLVRSLTIAGLLWSQIGHGATNAVLNLKDGLSVGTLRSCIANSSPGDTIIFSNGLTGTIVLTNGGQLVINKTLNIQGAGAKVLTISGNNTNRVFNVTNATVTISGLTIANGRVVGVDGVGSSPGQIVLGAGLLHMDSVAGYSVTVNDCVFLQNSIIGGIGGSVFMGTAGVGGDAYGAAVFNNSALILSNCTFSGNVALGGEGGGASNGGARGGEALGGAACNIGIMTLNNCTFAANSARGGMGGYGGQFFPGSGGNGEGGGIYNYGQVVFSSCTISSNTALGGSGNPSGINNLRGGAYGGGIRTGAGTSTSRSSIIAGNTGLQAIDVSGAFTSEGFNLIGVTNGSTGFGVIFDHAGTTNSPINPVLGGLQDNGGSTPTFALRMSSPAIDQGSNFGGVVDQRGAPRAADFSFVPNAGDGSDIGAFELIPATLSIEQVNNAVVLSWSAYNQGFTLQSVTNLNSNNWVSVAGTPVRVGSWLYLTNTISTGNRFFQLRLRHNN